MTLRTQMQRIFQQEDINFLLTNRLPRRLLTQFIGWFSRIEQAPIPRLSISLWRLFSDLDLSDAGIRRFRSMHECFTRQLKAGARPIDPGPSVLVSPCDAIVGACGTVVGNELLQIKGFPYTLDDLLGRSADAYQNGRYVTLRLTSSMYHRFHAPHDCRVELVTYISGDTWNVNPIALKRVERLFCKNERVVVDTRLALGQPVTMVAVAAILVASVRLHFLDVVLNLRHRGPNVISCDATLVKGQEMGWFEHGSTIIVLAPDGFTQCEDVYEGRTIRVGEPLLRIP
ncbi:MAG: archaetidylserine decarboxylase [Pseudolabrys sp.]|jgi:phosphatidylserine decarboxylase